MRNASKCAKMRFVIFFADILALSTGVMGLIVY